MSYWLQDKSIKQPLIISLNINLFWTHEDTLTNRSLRRFSPFEKAASDIFLTLILGLLQQGHHEVTDCGMYNLNENTPFNGVMWLVLLL